MDETYIKVKGVWKYLYRAVDKAGKTVDFLLTAKRDMAAAKRFLYKAKEAYGKPEKIAMDKSGANKPAIDAINANRDVPIVVRQVNFLNNKVEQDHRAIKRVTKPMLNFKSFHAARSVLAGVELMLLIRKVQFTRDLQATSFADQFYVMAGQVRCDPKLHTLLLAIDRDLAAQARRGGCGHCGGVLHSAQYPCKARGLPSIGPGQDSLSRFSCCCETCRRRSTPASVSGKPAALYPGSVRVGTISSMFNTMELVMNGIAAKQSRKEVEWRQRLARFATSGQQIESFCQAASVSEAVFYRWRKQLAAVIGAAPAAGFIDAGVMPPAPPVPSMTHCESVGTTLEVRLDLGHGLVLQIVRR